VARYKVLIKAIVVKEYEAISSRRARRRILWAISGLSTEPRPAQAKQLPAQPSADDLQSCLKETDDYVTRGKTVLYVIGLTNSCDKRLRCEIFANVTGARGTALGHTIMTLGAAGSGAAAKQTYSMHVKAAGGMAQISRECKVL